MQDLIKDVLDTVRFKSAVYFKHGFCGNWGMNVPKGAYAQFHFVAGGHCILEVDEKVYELTKGDLVIFPKGHPHRIKESQERNLLFGTISRKEYLGRRRPFSRNG